MPATAIGAERLPAPRRSRPGAGRPVRARPRTFKVCKQKGCRYRTIAASAQAGRRARHDPRRPRHLPRGTDRSRGKRYDGLKLIGNVKRPKPRGARRKGPASPAPRRTRVFVNGSDGVSSPRLPRAQLQGQLLLRHQRRTATALDRLVAERCGVYGIYAFNSKGGRMTNSEAFYNNDSGFYVGQTPPQRGTKKRTLVKNVDSWGNVLGFSGTNMRYDDHHARAAGSTTARESSRTRSTARSTRRPQDNVIADNDVFWNNFNFYFGGAVRDPGPVGGRPSRTRSGSACCCSAARSTTVEGNRIFGALPGELRRRSRPCSWQGSNNPKLREAVGAAGHHRAQATSSVGRATTSTAATSSTTAAARATASRAITLRSPNLPANELARSLACPGPAQNTSDPAVAVNRGTRGVGGDRSHDPATFEASWVRHPHSTAQGRQPLERFTGN